MGDTDITPVPPVPDTPDPHLYLVETLRLTSVLGDYGAGRIVKTFSLLPGEITKISVKTFRQTETTRKEASSVLDSLTKESAEDLETSLTSEQSDQQSYQQTKEYYVEATGNATWGWGSAEAKAGAKGSTNASRQEAVKNISNATQKHASKASAKREVEINTSYEVSEKTGEELSIERQIENINLSRTLNFVFRQMNQEFITFLHLTDVRVCFMNGDPKSTREVPLSGLESLLSEVVKPSKQDVVRTIILEQLSAIRDHAGTPVDVVKEVAVVPGDEYRQFDPDAFTEFLDKRKRPHKVPGVLLRADYHVMRTEGVIVEALLGNGPALDSYAEELQQLEVERRKALVAKHEHLAEQLDLINKVIDSGNEAKAGIAERLICRCWMQSEDTEHEHEGSAPSSPTPPPMSNGDGDTDVVSAGDRAVTEPATRATGYGDRATGAGARVAEAPKKKKAPPPKTPSHVAKAEAAFKKLFPNDKQVKIMDFDQAPSRFVRRDGKRQSPGIEGGAIWGAWTNSGTEFFVSVNARHFSAKHLENLLRHEYTHIEQFRSKGRPKTYEQGADYELEAYQKDYARAQALPDTHADKKTLLAAAKKGMEELQNEIITPAKKLADPGAREAFILDKMKEKGFLPSDAPATPDALYEPP
jgi:hypothetical protein